MLEASLRADGEKSLTTSSVYICSYPHYSLPSKVLGKTREAKFGLKQHPHKAQITWPRRAHETEDREEKEIRHVTCNTQFLSDCPQSGPSSEDG